ncbi:hypothetical protein V6N13_095075 [Hibiscus sabdariffa]|uniref:ARID domain-containing protein n=1 Tax=Hibiscus sabdariffa TaxID=183260 RepID=A0ABR2PTI1_9ROSI
MADRQGEKEDHRLSIALGKRKEPDVPAAGCSNNSCNIPMLDSDQTTIPPAPSVRNQPPFTAVCPVCNKEKECSRIVLNRIVLCRRCNEFYQATEPKFPPPRSSTSFRNQFPRRMDDSNSINVSYNVRYQLEHALNDPQYFDKLLESLWKQKNKPFLVPMFQGKELNMHRIFAEVTSRGGIHMVTREGRLPEVCAAIDENLRDGDLYHIYMEQLYDIETFLCGFLTNRRLSSSVGQHLMQGLVGQNRSSSSETAGLVSSLSGEQYPSQWIQASASYTSSAPVNNNQLLMNQCIQQSALYTSSEPMNIDRHLTIQPIRALAPYTSSASVNNNQQLMSQCIQQSALYTSSEPVNIDQHLNIQPIRALAPYTSSAAVNNNQQLMSQCFQPSALYTSSEPVNIDQHLNVQPIRALAPYTSLAPVNNNQQLMSQWIQPSALYTSSETVNIDQQLTIQPIQASAPYTSLAPVINNHQSMSQRIQPSVLYTRSAPVNNNQQLMSQWIQPSALYTMSEPVNVHQQLPIQPIRASAPCTSSAPVNISQQLMRQWIRASAPNTSAAPLNINQHLTSQPTRASAPNTSAALVNINQHLTSQPIRASAPHTNSAAGNNNQQLPGSSSGPHPMQMVTGGSPPNLTDNPQDFPSADGQEVQPLQQKLQFPDAGSTGIDMFHRHPWEHPGAQQSNSESDSSSPSASRKQS